MIRVAIVADSPVLRAALSSVISGERDMEIVATVDGLERDDGDVDVLIWAPRRARTSDDTPGHDGDLDEASPRPATMVLLERMDLEAARDAYGDGARAVLTLDTGDDELLSAIRAIAAGLVVVPSAVSADLFARTRTATAYAGIASPAVVLTPREREVLTLLAQGLANKAIAPRLGITEHTVKTHVAAIYEKLNASNRAEAVVAAARQGLIML